MKKKNVVKRLLAGVLTTAMVVTMLPVISKPITAKAVSEKTVAGLSTYAIGGPKTPASKNDAWKGSYVWYGEYDDSPVKYRVLSNNINAYTKSSGIYTMLLDCDQALYNVNFSSLSYPYSWSSSSVKSGLNGSDFLQKSGVFTPAEKNAIAFSNIASHDLDKTYPTTDGYVDSYVYSMFETYTALNGEKIFLLDAEDVEQNKYGYYHGNTAYCLKKQNNGTWMLRSDVKQENSTGSHHIEWKGKPGLIYYNSYSDEATIHYGQSSLSYGIAPAFNIDQSKVIFSTLVAGAPENGNAEYKLTLSDSKLQIMEDGELMEKNGKVTVPYAKSGDNAGKSNRVSVLILDRPYRAGLSLNVNVLYYGKLNGSNGMSGTGTFNLPSNLSMKDWGTGYYVYLLAEILNGDHYSDYANEPRLLSKPTHEHSLVYHKKDVVTCTKDGNLAYYECEGCRRFYKDKDAKTEITDRQSVFLPMTGHNWSDWKVIKAPTTEKAGTKERTCSICGKVKTASIPAIAKKTLSITLKNECQGVRISWKAKDYAAKYVVYKKNEKGNWARKVTVKSTEYLDSSVKAGEKATYTVVALNADGVEISDYGTGKSIKFTEAEVVTNVKYKASGVSVSWAAVNGAAKYRIFRKVEGGDWAKLATTTDLSYVDKTVVYGKTYSYAVRAMSSGGSFISVMGNGSSIKYLAPIPEITAENDQYGIDIHWSAMSGASKYRLFVKNDSGTWTKVATVKGETGYYIDSVSIGKTYTYTVVGMDSAGRLMNDYGTGITIKREYSELVLPFDIRMYNGYFVLYWGWFEEAGKFRIYRKTDNGEWQTLKTIPAGSDAYSYKDDSVEHGKRYTYAIVAMTADGKEITAKGDGTSRMYLDPVQMGEILAAEVTDENGNTVERTISEEEICEDIVEVITEEAEEVSEDPEEVSEDGDNAEAEKAQDAEPEEEAVEAGEEEEISEDAQIIEADDKEVISEEEAVTEEADEANEVESISETELTEESDAVVNEVISE